MPFRDRTEAGRRLGEALCEQGVEADLVLAIPRGGLPLGRAVADALDLPLDIAVAGKIGAPNNPEFAIGAVAADGSVWLNDRVIDERGIDEAYVERERRRERENARRKAETYREDAPDLDGEAVIVVDDGVATGATMRACIAGVRNRGAERIVVAVPVGSPRTIDSLSSLADAVVCLETPRDFRAVGQFYERFDQVFDEEAMAYLGREG